MLGSTLTVTLDGSGGTAKVLPLINQDGYGTEYFLDEGLITYRAKVRHSRDNVKAGTQQFDRHTVTFSRFVKPTATIPLGSLTEVTSTIRTDPNGVPGDIIDMSEAMSFYMVKAGGIAAKLLGWES
ncbi:MAG: putative coat protein [Leviviridae sp.]|nr:MAG: putative coat protein [Leviviridae sp.]